MMKVLRVLLVLTMFCLTRGGVLYAQPTQTLSEAGNRFAFDLYGRYAAQAGNVFFSPYSLFTALGMTYEGARGNTADEMRRVLYLPDDNERRHAEFSFWREQMGRSDKLFEFVAANALWVQKDFVLEQGYLDAVRSVYGGEARSLDFIADAENSRITINGWVMEQTKGRIKDLLPSGSLDDQTRLVLTNTVYFKGKWQEAFDQAKTRQMPFFVTADFNPSVDMMSRTGRFFYAQDGTAQLLRIPYRGDELSMVVVLPRDFAIAGFEKKFALDKFRELMGNGSVEKVDVLLPVFEFDVAASLKEYLMSLGMEAAFSRQADFSGMTGVKDLFISEVFHQARVRVDEEGAEAAAASAVVMQRKSASAGEEGEMKEFHAVHPFIFMIVENNSGMILFMGRVSDPSVK